MTISCTLGVGPAGTFVGAQPQSQTFNVAGLPIWSAAVRAVRAGTAHARILCIGHSITEGEGSSGSGRTGNPKASSWPTQLAGLLTAADYPASWRNVMSSGYGSEPYSDFDARVTYGANWANSVFGFGGKMFHSMTANTDWAFAHGGTVDRFDFYYATNSGLGTFTVSTDGTVRATVNTGVAASVGKTVVSFPATTAPILIRQPTTFDAYVIGGHAYLSTAKEIAVCNAGWGGSTAADWASTSAGYNAFYGIGTLAPHLTLINLDINDANAAVSTTTFATQLGAIIDEAKLSGDVLCLISPPTDPATTVAYAAQTPYADAIVSVSAAKGLPAPVNMRTAYGNVFQSAKMYDRYHPNFAGAADIAAAVRARIAP